MSEIWNVSALIWFALICHAYKCQTLVRYEVSGGVAERGVAHVGVESLYRC